MRKVIILVILALSIFLCYTMVANGLEIGESLAISNYEDVEKSSKDIDTLISQLANLNNEEFETKKENLQKAIESYKKAKEEYEEMEAVIEAANNQEVEVSLVDIYDVDFLWTIIGNYGTEEGISLKFDVSRSASSSLISEEYTMCDLKFTISGDYIALTDFIYDIEEDSKLGFEISDFEIARGGENLQATFTVKEVPINNENLTELQTSVDTGASSDNTNTANNTVTNSSTTGNTSINDTTTDITNTVY